VKLITGQHQALPFPLPTPLVCLVAAAGVALWIGLHALGRRVTARWARAILFPLRVAVGFVAILAVMDLVQLGFVFATNWPLWPLALTGALAIEVLLVLYALERRIVSRRTGLALAIIRVALVLLVVAMLAQPVRSIELSHSLQRYVAVLVDNSASMHVPDKQMTPAERIRLGELLMPDAPARPYTLEAVARRLREVREKLAPQIDWLSSLREAKPDVRLKQLESRRRAAQEAIQGLERAVAEQAAEVGKPLKGSLQLDSRAQTALTFAQTKLVAEVQQHLAVAARMLDRSNLPALSSDCEPLADTLRGVSAALAKLEPGLTAAGDALDEALYGALSAEERSRIDSLALQPRFALAREILYLPERKPAPGLLQQLEDKYGVRLYTFAASPTEVSIEKGLEPEPGESGVGGKSKGEAGKPTPKTATPASGHPTPSPQHPTPSSPSSPPTPNTEHRTPSPPSAADLPPEQQQTNLTAALEKVISEIPADRLAGIVLLSDGRHNAPSAVEPMARRVGLEQAPICSILFGGGAKPTTDAAVTAVEAPETVYAKDKVYVNAEVRLDGLAGRTVRVRLYDGDTPVDSDEIRVEADSFRTRIQLSDEPKEAGLHAYRVRIDEMEGEVLTSNNERPLSVSVTGEQTRLLIVEGRPRWEFRYLKNLFASRDRTVRLQYVVLRPDAIPGQPLRQGIPASAARPPEQPEATALPENEGEWMKFDVIILGDVEPDSLSEEHQKALKKFVEERGGTLIVISGPRSMPHAYAGSPLAELLPVSFERPNQPNAYLPAPEKSFRIALTPEGRDHVITRLRVDPNENLETWGTLPEIRWRHPLLRAKTGATVLAYALPPDAPDFISSSSSFSSSTLPPKAQDGSRTTTRTSTSTIEDKQPASGETLDAETARPRQDFIADHALITLHNLALGRVMCLSFDHTWRFRYCAGDTHHHRFWGQVLRWATSDRLPAGGQFVKLGTDRPRYSAHAKVRVRAKLVQPDFSPVVSDDVAVNIYAIPPGGHSRIAPPGGYRTGSTPASYPPEGLKPSGGGKLVLRRKLEYLPNSLGVYTADLGELAAGTYRVELDAPAAKPLLAAENIEKVASEFFVEQAVPSEQIELSADRGLLERLATLTHGIVVDPPRASDLLAALGAPTLTHSERREWALWDSWPLLVMIVVLAGAEWLLRKRARLP